MKSKILFFLLVLFAPVIIYKFYYPSPESLNPPEPLQSSFILGAMNNSADVNYDYISNPAIFGMNSPKSDCRLKQYILIYNKLDN